MNLWSKHYVRTDINIMNSLACSGAVRSGFRLGCNPKASNQHRTAAFVPWPSRSFSCRSLAWSADGSLWKEPTRSRDAAFSATAYESRRRFCTTTQYSVKTSFPSTKMRPARTTSNGLYASMPQGIANGRLQVRCLSRAVSQLLAKDVGRERDTGREMKR